MLGTSMCAIHFVNFVIVILLTDVNGVKKKLEEKDKLVHPLNHSGNNNLYNYLHKRQISAELTQSLDSQYFQTPFGTVIPNVFPNKNDRFNIFLNVGAQDEEDRFFLSGENPVTTFNPLSFINPTTTTPNPIQRQQLIEERRFQKEIADKGLKEQQEQSFGVPRPQTTTNPSPPTIQSFFNRQNSFDYSGSLPFPSGQYDFPSPNSRFPSSNNDYENPISYSSVVRSLPQSYSNSQSYKKKRSIDRQASTNDLGSYVSSTVPPFMRVFQSTTVKNDLIQISNWLIDNLAKQIQQNIVHLGGVTPQSPIISQSYHQTPAPNYKLPNQQFISTTEEPQVLIGYDQSTTKIEPRLPWGIEQHDVNYEHKLPKKVTNVHIIPSSTTEYFPAHNNKLYDPRILQAYKQIYDVDHQTITPVENTLFQSTISPFASTVEDNRPITTTVYTSSLQPILNFNQPIEAGVSITSLFRSKLNSLKPTEILKRNTHNLVRCQSYSEFQQPDRFFDQLQQSNASTSDVYSTSTHKPDYENGVSRTAIFIKMPENTTRGYLFDKTISAKTKKENINPKSKPQQSRSAQLIRSSLVYRTAPEKRAIVSKSEIVKNNQLDINLLSNLFGGTGTPMKWLFGNKQLITTNRPLVTAFSNFIQKRST